MASPHIIKTTDGKSMLSARKVAARLGCAQDYVGKLCREGKLNGQRIDQVWFVEVSSVAAFEAARRENRAARSEKLSSLRKQELSQNGFVPKKLAPKLVISGALMALAKAALVSAAVGIAVMGSVALTHSLPLARTQTNTAAIAQINSPFFGAQVPHATGGFSIFAWLASLFAPAQIAQAPSNFVPEVSPSSPQTFPQQPSIAAATSTPPASTPRTTTTIVQNYPVIQRTVEHTVVQSGVTEDELTAKLQELGNALRSQLYGASASSPSALPAQSGFSGAIAISQNIDKLNGVTITNSTIDGYLPLGGGTLGGALTGTTIAAATASTTNLIVSGLGGASGCLTPNADGTITTAPCSAGSGAAFAWTPTTFGSTAAVSTSTLIGFTNGLYALSSSTLQNVTFQSATGTALTLGTALGVGSGGTGIGAAPAYGQLLVGNGAGGYNLLATSSLGIAGGGGGGTWGSITGTLSSQTDLQNALNAKLALTAWYATTTDALAEGVNRLYYTNARVDTEIGNFIQAGSGINLTNNGSSLTISSTGGGGGGGTDVNWTYFNGSAIRPATSTNQVLIGGTATSTLAKLQVIGGAVFDNATTTRFVVTGAATSTFGGGINLSGGCFSINGVCITGGGGSGTVTSVALSGGTTGLTVSGSPITTSGTITLGGTLAIANGGTGTSTAPSANKLMLSDSLGNWEYVSTSSLGIIGGGGAGNPGGSNGQIQFNNGGSFDGGLNFVWDAIHGRVGIGTTSPYAMLSVAGQVVGQNFVATSTTAVSSFQQFLANASSTLQNFTALNSTSSNATSTNFFATTASSTNLFASTLNVDNNTLFVDNINHRVGIGTTSPQGLLDVVGSSNSLSAAFTGARAVSLTNTDTTNGNMAGFDFRTNDLAGTLTTGAKILTVFNSHATGLVSADMAFRTNNAGTMSEVMRLTAAGNVGIGTASPTAKLTVAGGIQASGNITAGSITDNGDLTVAGNTNLIGNLTFNNFTAIGGTTTSLFTSTLGLGAGNYFTSLLGNGLANVGGVLTTTFSTTTTNIWTSLQQFEANASTTGLSAGFAYFGTTATSSFNNIGDLFVVGSTTLQNFTFLNATGTNATTTNFFANVASSTNLFAQTASFGSLSANSLTLAAPLAISSGGTNASSFGTSNGLTYYDGTRLMTNAGLTFDGTTLTATYASSTALTATNLFSTNFLALGSTTLQNFTFLNATGTNATTTNFFATTASSTNLFASVGQLGTFLALGSTTLQNFTFLNATGTNATTTNFFATTASSTNLFAQTASFGSLFANSLTAYASSTIGYGTQTGGLTIFGGATTTGNAYFGGQVGIGTAAPGRTLDVSGTARVSSVLTLSNSPSCIGQEALQTNSSGDIACGAISVTGLSTSGGWTTNNLGSVTLSTTTDRVGIGATTTPYAALSVIASDAATTTLALRPASGATANILDIYNTSGVLSSVFTAGGSLGIGTIVPSHTLDVSGTGYISGNTTIGGALTSANFLALGSTTLQNFTFLSATGTNATTTNFFATTASSTNLFAATAQFGALTLNNLSAGGLAINSSGAAYTFSTSTWIFASSTLLANNNTFSGNTTFTAASTTLQNFTFLSATGTNATTTSFAIAGIASGNLLKTTAGGALIAAVAGTDYATPGSVGTAYPFQLTGNATSTLTQFNGGLTAYASSTIALLSSINSTSTNATSTNLYATALNAGTLTGAGLAACSSDTSKLLWANGTFTCGITGSLANENNWLWFNGSGLQLGTTSNQVLIGAGATTTLAALEVAGSIAQRATGNPTLAAGSASTDLTYQTVIAGNYDYIAEGAGGLRIMDITNPKSPATVGSYALGGALSVAVAGHYAYVGDITTGLNIIDVTNPNAPVKAGSYSFAYESNSFFPYGIALSGKYVYLTDLNNNSVQILDISNPAAPRLVGTYTVTGGASYGIAVAGAYAYVTEPGVNKIHIVDISNPAAPALVGSYTATGINPYGVYASGKFLYVADAVKGFYIVNVSNPASPSLVGQYKPDTSDAYYGLSVAGNYAYVADHGNGKMLVIDTSNPASPSLVGSYAVTNGSPMTLALGGKYAYVADYGGGVKVVDINGLSTPAATIGALAANQLNVSDNLAVGGDITAGGGLDVGISGIFSRGTIAAYIASSTQINPVVASFFGGNVGIGTTSPYAMLSVAGQVVGQNFVATSTTAVSSFQQFLANASSTLQNFTALNSTSSNATSTNFFATTASSTNLFASTLNVDNNTLFVDNINHRVGIGTTTPYAQLSVNPNGITGPAFVIGSSTSTFFNVTNGGLVGINASSEDDMLAIKGNGVNNLFETYDNTGVSKFLIQNGGNVGIGQTVPGSALSVNGGISAGTYSATAAPSGGMIISGNVGIGTTTPGSLLNVVGTLGSQTPLFTIASTTATNVVSSLWSVAASGLQTFGFDGDQVLTSDSDQSKTRKGSWGVTGGALSTLLGGVIPHDYLAHNVSQSASGAWNTVDDATSPSIVRTWLDDNGYAKTFYAPAGAGTPVFGSTPTISENLATGDVIYKGNASSTQLTTTGSTYLATAGGNVGIGTTTPGSQLSIGNTGGINFVPTATSTFSASANGINITNGCFAIGGVCVGGGGSGITSVTADWPLLGLGTSGSHLTWGGIATSSNIVSGQPLYATGVNTFQSVASSTFFTSIGGYSWPFPSNATTTGLGIFASSTIGNGTQAGGLTISGGATTTGNAYFAGNVGIATSSPTSKFSVGGDFFVGASTAGGTNGGLGVGVVNTTAGTISAKNFINTNGTTGGYQIDGNLVLQASSTRLSAFVGQGSGNNSYTGNQNFGMGVNSLSSLTSGTLNVGVGYYALNADTTGSANVAIGYNVLYQNTTGASNVALGNQTLASNTSGSNNVAAGAGALNANTTGSDNIANGYFALGNNTTGIQNIASGHQALAANTTGGNNIAAGYLVMLNNTTGADNVATGLNALYSNTVGTSSIGIGDYALYSNTTGSYDVAIGRAALYDLNITANDLSGNNTAIGNNTGRGIVTGINNTVIGAQVTGLAAGLSNNIILANGAGTIKAQNDGTNWNFTGNVGIGTTSPYAKLSIGGDVVVGAATAGGTLGNLYLTALLSQSCLGTDSTGKVGAGTCSGGGIGDPFTHTPVFGQTTSATSTLLALTGSPYSLVASSSVAIGTAGNAFIVNSTGVVTSGTWNGHSIDIAYGGLGANFSGSSGALSISGGTVSAGTLSIANGGTGTTTGGVTNGVEFWNGSTLTNSANHTFITSLTNGTTGLGIGTTSPYALLSLAATPTASSSANVLFAISSSTAAFATTTLFSVANTGNATFTGTGGTCVINGSGNCTSDARLKTNIAPISGADALNKLALLSGVTYNWVDPGLDQSQRVGVIAQDVLKAFPQLVGTAQTTLNGVGGTYYTVDYGGLTAPLISGVNELNVRTAALASTTTTLSSTTVLISSAQAADEVRLSAVEARLDGLASTTAALASSTAQELVISAPTVAMTQAATTTIAAVDGSWSIATSTAATSTPIVSISAGTTTSVSINAAHVYLNGQELSAAVSDALIGTSTAGTTGTTTTNFMTALTAKLTAWLASAGNGVADLFAAHIHAQTIDAQTVTTQTLCIGATCVTENQLKALLNGQSSTSTTSTINTTGTTSSNGSSPSDTAPTVSVNGANPTGVAVGANYVDLGATITGPTADLNLGISASVDGGATTSVSQIQVDTSVGGTHYILFSVTDQAGLTGTATRTVIVGDGAATATATATSTTSTINTTSTTASSTATSTTP